MEDLKDVYASPLPQDSPYVRPFRLNYTQKDKEKSWDLLQVLDTVVIVVFNVTRNVMVLVKQFRPALYYNCIPPEERQGTIDTTKYPASLGITLEVCAGIADKNIPLIEIAKEEVIEECGYAVQTKDLEKIMSYRAAVGVQGSLQTLYYCEVTDDMKTGKGGPKYIHIYTKSRLYPGGMQRRWHAMCYAPYILLSLPQHSYISSYMPAGFVYYELVLSEGRHLSGGGVDDEIIDVVEKTIPEIDAMMQSPGPLSIPPSCLFAILWFLHYRADKYRK